MLILALLEERPMHGYTIAKSMADRSGGVLEYHAASLYPVLYKLEERGLIQGRWLEKAGERRRRFYKPTAKGKKLLAEQRSAWAEFSGAVAGIIGGAA